MDRASGNDAPAGVMLIGMESHVIFRQVGRRLSWLFALLTVPYAIVCAFIYSQQRSLIYLPGHTRIAPDQTDFALLNDGLTLRGWRLNPGRDKVLLYFGGNAESLSSLRQPLSTLLPEYTLYLLAYRGYGASDGEPSQTALFADALALFDHVRNEHPDQPVAVIGRSLGSGVAAYLAGQRPVELLVLVTPFDSLANVAARHYPWLPVHRLLHDRFDSAQHLAGYAGPVLVIAAAEDRVIPADSTDRLIASLSRAPQIVVLPTSGHNVDLLDSDAGGAIARFLE